MGRKTYGIVGDWNALCDVCGFKMKASKLKKRWDGLYVCIDDYEKRHPSDLFRVPKEDTTVPWVRVDDDAGTLSLYVIDIGGDLGTGFYVTDGYVGLE
ncbi:MAG: hypothetical protein JKY96_04465 [Phycisphaerales bacterium]|nr:hypothetical protein [Phycisphaerales bacterium]